MLKQASLRLLSADELAVVAGGDSPDEITVTATRYMEDNRISDFHFFGGGGGGGFSYDFSWLTGYGENFVSSDIAASDSDGDGIPDNVDPDPDVPDIVIIQTAMTPQEIRAYDNDRAFIVNQTLSAEVLLAAYATYLRGMPAAIAAASTVPYSQFREAMIQDATDRRYRDDVSDGSADGSIYSDRYYGLSLGYTFR